MSITAKQFVSCVRENPINDRLLSVLPSLRLPQCALTAGCLFQTLWNLKSGNDPRHGIKDYDVFYFDDSDLSWEAEDAVIRRVRDAFDDVAGNLDIKNQARVHLWYSETFGRPCPRLVDVEDGIDRYLISCTRIGLKVESGCLYAPDTLDDMWDGILRMNPLNAQPDRFIRKCQEYVSRWPWLEIASS